MKTTVASKVRVLPTHVTTIQRTVGIRRVYERRRVIDSIMDSKLRFLQRNFNTASLFSATWLFDGYVQSRDMKQEIDRFDSVTLINSGSIDEYEFPGLDLKCKPERKLRDK